MSEEIKEKVKEENFNIKELVFSLNTITSGNASFDTKLINGVLEGIIVSTQEEIQLKISLINHNINIFEVSMFQGTQFIPMRIGLVSNKGETFRDCCEKWPLNDKLRFEIKGAMNSEVKFVVRYQ